MKFSSIENTLAPRTGYRVYVAWRELRDKFARWEEQGLELDPDFQRGHVWSQEQQIAYLEYAMRGGVSGMDLYFNCGSWGAGYNTPIYLVDGKQRLTAVFAFLDGKVPAFGHYIHEYEDRLPFEFGFHFNMNNLRARREMLAWYIGLNGGVAHTEEEINRVKALME